MGCITSKCIEFTEIKQDLRVPRQHLDLSHIDFEEIIDLSVELADSSKDNIEEYDDKANEYDKLIVE